MSTSSYEYLPFKLILLTYIQAKIIGGAKCIVAHTTKILGWPWPTRPTLQRPPW